MMVLQFIGTCTLNKNPSDHSHPLQLQCSNCTPPRCAVCVKKQEQAFITLQQQQPASKKLKNDTFKATPTKSIKTLILKKLPEVGSKTSLTRTNFYCNFI